MRRLYICGGEEDARAADVRLQPSKCSREHTPMPAAYGAWMEIADRRDRAGQIEEHCPVCHLFRNWRGGRDVPGWPRQMSTVLRQRKAATP